ncbi:MAG TPA: hypothetical protein VLG38_00495, partial [Gammaproteobacteria bacterium]|nr:hypothetical protein [Gammaproteobacteria bacterium]
MGKHKRWSDSSDTHVNPHLSRDDRWNLLQSTNIDLSPKLLVKLYAVLAERNKVLKYFLDTLTPLGEDGFPSLNDLKRILLRLSPAEFAVLLDFCDQAPKVLRKHIPAKVDKHNTTKFIYNKELNDQEELTHDAVYDESIELLVDHMEELVNLAELGDSAFEYVDRITEHVRPQMAVDTIGATASEAILPFAGLAGVYQSAYETSYHNAIIRNVHTEYKLAIKLLSPREIKAIIDMHPGDAEEQIAHIKEYTKTKMISSMRHNTFIAGTIYSLLFAAIASFLIGPGALGIALGGMAVSGGAAVRNGYLLDSKIDTFIKGEHNDTHIDDLVVAAINDTNIKHKEGSKDLDPVTWRDYMYQAFSNIPQANTLLGITIRIAGLIWYGIIAVVFPMVFGTIAVINALFTCGSTRSYLKSMRDDPKKALRGGLFPLIEVPGMSATTFKNPTLNRWFGRNKFYSYLLHTKKLDAIQREFIAHDIPLKQTTSKAKNRLRTVMSTLGIWEKQDFNNVLETLYDGSNPRATKLLHHLRAECRQYEFEKAMALHLRKNRKTLGLRNKTLKDLLTEHAHGNSANYNKLLHSYLATNAENNAWWSVIYTGASTTFATALMVAAIGLTFFPPLIVPFLIASASILAAGVFVTLFAAIRETNKVSKKVRDPAAFDEMLKSTDIPSMNQYLSKKPARAPSMKNLLDSTDLPLSKLVSMYAPKGTLKTASLQDSVHAMTRTLSNSNVTQLTEKFVTKSNAGSLSLYEGNTALLTIPKDEPNTLNLHDGAVRAWQSTFSTLKVAHLSGNPEAALRFTLANNFTTADNVVNRGHNFLHGLALEFATDQDLQCPNIITFKEFTTAEAVYRALLNPAPENKEYADKLRAHFGLLLIKGKLQPLHRTHGGTSHPFYNPKYAQNAHAFDRFIDKIHQKAGSTKLANINTVKSRKRSF